MNVGMTSLVGLESRKITVDVGVGEAVCVFSGVGVGVSVNVLVGNAAAVLEAATFAVCAMKVLIKFGSAVGSGAASEGTHAITNTSTVNQIRNFVLRVDIFPLPHPKRSRMQFSYLSTLITV